MAVVNFGSISAPGAYEIVRDEIETGHLFLPRAYPGLKFNFDEKYIYRLFTYKYNAKVLDYFSKCWTPDFKETDWIFFGNLSNVYSNNYVVVMEMSLFLWFAVKVI